MGLRFLVFGSCLVFFIVSRSGFGVFCEVTVVV